MIGQGTTRWVYALDEGRVMKVARTDVPGGERIGRLANLFEALTWELLSHAGATHSAARVLSVHDNAKALVMERAASIGTVNSAAGLDAFATVFQQPSLAQNFGRRPDGSPVLVDYGSFNALVVAARVASSSLVVTAERPDGAR